MRVGPVARWGRLQAALQAALRAALPVGPCGTKQQLTAQPNVQNVPEQCSEIYCSEQYGIPVKLAGRQVGATGRPVDATGMPVNAYQTS